ncbi:hypothetical protein PG984_011927 [Apiospora sp. TS-2023a]
MIPGSSRIARPMQRSSATSGRSSFDGGGSIGARSAEGRGRLVFRRTGARDANGSCEARKVQFYILYLGSRRIQVPMSHPEQLHASLEYGRPKAGDRVHLLGPGIEMRCALPSDLRKKAIVGVNGGYHARLVGCLPTSTTRRLHGWRKGSDPGPAPPASTAAGRRPPRTRGYRCSVCACTRSDRPQRQA